MQNPYNLTFGLEPLNYISRKAQEDEILEAFQSENPVQRIYMITGLRGSGKTVFMTNVSKRIAASPDWTVIELNPIGNLLESLGAKLLSNDRLSSFLNNLNISLSLFGIQTEIKKGEIVDTETAITTMLERVKKAGKRILITIDEVTNSEEIRRFTSFFQILLRQESPVYLLMTGLYENIGELQDEKNLTFLYRAPKVILKPLNLGAMANDYEHTLKVDREHALSLARMTNGYAFAFQILGYLSFKYQNTENIREEYQQYLEEYVYEKIWAELSPGDKKVAYAIAKTKSGKIQDVREVLNMDTNCFNPYRKRLIRKGILNGEERGFVHFTIPLFDVFVLENYSLI